MKKRLPKRGKYWQTTEKGAEIPVPTKRNVFRDLKKAAQDVNTQESPGSTIARTNESEA